MNEYRKYRIHLWIHKMEYYSALKKNVIPLWQEIWSILCQEIQAGLPSRVLLTAKGKMTI